MYIHMKESTRVRGEIQERLGGKIEMRDLNGRRGKHGGNKES